MTSPKWQAQLETMLPMEWHIFKHLSDSYKTKYSNYQQ
jgi:hypothetical protein